MSYSHGELVQLAEEGRRKKMPKRYIEAERLKRHMAQKPEEWRTPDERWLPERDIALYIDTCPEADVVERKKGEWNVIWGGEVVCSECKMGAPEAMSGCLANRHLEQIRTNFCPNCGADMRGERDAEVH